jgi:two-component system nitrogen regulation sensor histidine kinase NtrY
MNQPRLFGPYVSARASERGITGVYAFDAKGRAYVESGLGLLSARKQDIESIAANLKGEEMQSVASPKRGQVTGLVRLPIYFESDVYLYMERPIAQEVIAHVDALSETLDEFERLTGARAQLQIGFYALFALVSLLMLLAAVWLGFMIADQIARPISQLINAAERVAAGDLRARVSEGEPGDEVASLSRSFNRMTAQLERNREELVEANRQIDARREFTETVLEGVTAGVIGIDAEGRINLPNRHASELLATNLQERIGRPLAESAPEFAALLAQARLAPPRGADGELEILRGEKRRTLFARIAPEEVGGQIVGYVVTFDDITELQQAQRKAAWADVARRIAHEIKNPLTPIQLSAERLKRKYMPQQAGERDAFALYTDTIIRQVGDIGRLVDEFSTFARMPLPSIRPEDLREVCRHAVFLERNAHPEIEYALTGADRPLILNCDGRQVSQALINLLRNAADAILEPRRDLSKEAQAALPPGRIDVALAAAAERVTIVVADNGKGLPAHLVHKLTEPYVTTRVKGTGLGLAIARKIVEDHGGSIRLENREGGGAKVTLELPRPAAAERPAVPDRAAE